MWTSWEPPGPRQVPTWFPPGPHLVPTWFPRGSHLVPSSPPSQPLPWLIWHCTCLYAAAEVWMPGGAPSSLAQQCLDVGVSSWLGRSYSDLLRRACSESDVAYKVLFFRAHRMSARQQIRNVKPQSRLTCSLQTRRGLHKPERTPCRRGVPISPYKISATDFPVEVLLLHGLVHGARSQRTWRQPSLHKMKKHTPALKQRAGPTAQHQPLRGSTFMPSFSLAGSSRIAFS